MAVPHGIYDYPLSKDICIEFLMIQASSAVTAFYSGCRNMEAVVIKTPIPY
jgi:hypothetical protein